MLKDIFTKERHLFLNRIGKSKPERPSKDDLIAAFYLIAFILFCLFGFSIGWHLANIF